MRWTWGQWAFSKLGAGAKWLLDFSYFGSSFVLWRAGTKGLAPRLHLRVPGASDHHLIAAFFALLYYYGIMQIIVKATARVMTRPDGRQWRGIAQRGSQYFHGPDGGAPHHSPVPAGGHTNPN